eukprot:TRINITY_DN19210_c0_g1_i1.p2 TRINITY_DN19210_c0_g1~~TRINITY_DN19210_c0_g1_i1.p2  ORF type:complete len:235 (+),score=67.29 TRINITY_DN19210_c0_g1_i1:86-706(+)
MPRQFVPVSDPERPKAEQDLRAPEFQKHRAFDALCQPGAEPHERPATVARTEAAQMPARGGMIKDEKGRWVKVKQKRETPPGAAAAAGAKRARGDGAAEADGDGQPPQAPRLAAAGVGAEPRLSKEQAALQRLADRRAGGGGARVGGLPPQEAPRRDPAPRSRAPPGRAPEGGPDPGGPDWQESLSVADTNRLRAQLGLRPLRAPE